MFSPLRAAGYWAPEPDSLLGSFVVGILLVPVTRITFWWSARRYPALEELRSALGIQSQEEAIWFLNTVSESMVVFFRGKYWLRFVRELS
jgi:hypothetical protein